MKIYSSLFSPPWPKAKVLKSFGENHVGKNPNEIVTFGICLSSKKSLPNWNLTCRLLSNTLFSILRQTDERFRIIICGHELPDIPEISDDRIEFLSLQNQPPAQSQKKFSNDKTRKRLNIGRRLRELGGGYLMSLDADDLVHKNIVRTVLDSQHPNGFVLTSGYVYDWSSGNIASDSDIWSVGLNMVCGSTSIVFYNPEDLPSAEDSPDNDSVLFNNNRNASKVELVMEEYERPLRRMPFPALIYVVNHSQNISFDLVRKGIRQQRLIKFINKHAVNDKNKLREINANFGTRLAAS